MSQHTINDSEKRNMNMITYPYEDAEQMGIEQSEESFKNWGIYWETLKKKEESIVNTKDGSEYDWRTCTNRGEHLGVRADDRTSASQEGPRWVFAMRHGERVDLTYGDWVQYCFDKKGHYTRKDLNMPEKLTYRSGGAESYARDTPLTRIGELQARLVGEGLRGERVRVRHVYASCALRSVATAHHMLKGLEADPSVKIRVEPGIFEFKKWYTTKGLAPFMTPQELHEAGYNVDLDYKPYIDLSLSTDESIEDYYRRNKLVVQSAVEDTKKEGGNIIFVGHASTLDMTATALTRFEKEEEFPPYQVSPYLLRVPYCAVAALREGPWRLVAPPCPPFACTSSGRFNWKILLDLVKQPVS